MQKPAPDGTGINASLARGLAGVEGTAPIDEHPVILQSETIFAFGSLQPAT